MAFKTNNKAAYTTDGIPYLWNSGDVTTIPSNEFKITANTATEDRFGAAVAVGSGRIVVGAYGDDDNGSNSGSAYIFDLDGNELAKITASDAAADDYFGNSVAVGSGRIVVGAYWDNTNAGSAYIFDLDGTQLAKITASDGAVGDEFGYSVAVGSGRIVVGAYKDDDNGSDSGSAYIFDLDGNQLAKILASDGASNDDFGSTVSVGSGRIVVGAPGDTVNGLESGSAYIYDLDGNQLTKILPSDGGAYRYFGNSAAVGSGRIVVGAYQDSENGSSSGSAYIFDLDGNELAKIIASDGDVGDYFGWSVAVGSGRIVISTWRTGDNGTDYGSAYIYDLDGNELVKINASDAAAGDKFGYSAAAGSGRIVVGADEDDDNGNSSGSAYIYETPQVYNLYDAIELKGVI